MNEYKTIGNKRLRNGPWQQHNSNGNLFWSGHYSNGKMDGLWEGYHKNGNLKYKLRYDMEKPISLWENYFANGELIEIRFYL